MKIQLTVIICIVVVLNSCGTLSPICEEKSGAELWSLNCARCHNIPSPSEYSASQWETIGAHMRSRSGINGIEMEKIVSFLKTTSPNGN